MSVIQGNAIESGLAAYEIPNSLRFNSADSAYLSWTPASAGTSATVWTFSWWQKGIALNGSTQVVFGAESGGARDIIRWDGSGTLEFYKATSAIRVLTPKYRDPSAWYHFVINVSGTTVGVYVNGVQVTAFTTSNNPSGSWYIGQAYAHRIGVDPTGGDYLSGYLTEVNFIDGQALDSTSFGEYNSETGVWQPKAYTGSYGTNGFYLPMTQDQIVEGFNTVLFRGNASLNKVTGAGLSPDLVWIKDRFFGSGSDHFLFDSLRGTKSLSSNTAGAETEKSSDGFTSLDADGFTLNGSGGGDNVNRSGSQMVAWCWDAGNSTVTNNDGTITGAQVRASQTYGFSVVTWASQSSGSATIGHGLGTAPSLIIQKNRSSGSTDWWVYHSSLGETKYTKLNTTDAQGTASSIWNDTAPTPTVFSNGSAFTPSANYVAYCFAETGYSKFGSYTGNGSSTGPTVTLGWKPAFVMIKQSSGTGGSWRIYDNTRETDEQNLNYVLDADSSSAEYSTSNTVKFTATGFQLTSTAGGTNGSGETYIYAAFKDQREAAFWRDFSGNGNHWQPNNLDFNDSVVDVPTNYGTDTGVGAEVRGNYATWNPLDKDDGISSVTEGNLKVVTNGSNGSIKSTIAFPSGKWYWEVTSDSISGSGTQAIGIMPQSQPPTNNMSDSGKLGYAIDASFSDRKFENGTATSYGSYTQANGAVYMLAFDQDAGKLWYGVNGTWLASGDPAAGTNPSSSSISTSTAYCAAVSDNTVSGTFTANFGQLPFAYTAPSGFAALCTQNLPEPTVVDGGDYFNPVLYTGNNSNGKAVTGVGFSPDFIWFKSQSAANGHCLVNRITGVNAGLGSDSTAAEQNPNLASFDADGFTVNSVVDFSSTNANGNSIVAWNWKAGGTGVSNTAGTNTSAVVSANTTSGFSIITYNGTGSNATVGHGCQVGGVPTAPSLVIVKRRNGGTGYSWHVQHISTGNTRALFLDSTSAGGTSIVYWNNTSPTSTVVSTGTDTSINGSGGTFVMYCFAPVEGYSAFGSYTGNGSSDGPFVYTGFRPRYIMLKCSSTSGLRWNIFDTSRSPYNVGAQTLYADSSAAEDSGTGADYDILSNGFKLRSTNSNPNTSGATYIYAAFAENPFKYSLAR